MTAAPAAAPASDLAVTLCTTQAQLAEAYRIRIEVFAIEQQFGIEDEVDE